MSYEDSENVERDDNDRLTTDEEQKPMLENLIIKNGPNGYTVEKKRKKPLTQEELSHVYTKYVEQSPYFANYFASNANLQESSQPINICQDPAVDSTKPDDDLEQKKSNLIESDLDFYLEQNSFSTDFLNSSCSTLIPPSPLEISKQLFDAKENHNSEVEFAIGDYESFREKQGSIDPIILSRSLGGGYFVKKDCFLGEKCENISGLDDFQVDQSNYQVKLNYSDWHFQQPLERLFSNVSDDASEATTKTVASSDEMEYATDVETDEDPNENSQKTQVLDDGSILVVNRSNSNVIIAGYD